MNQTSTLVALKLKLNKGIDDIIYLIKTILNSNELEKEKWKDLEFIFTNIKSNEYMEVAKFFVTLPNEMIHAENDLMFILAAEKGYVEVMKYLVELTPDKRRRERMIHALYDKSFVMGAMNGHLEVVRYLIELTPEEEMRNSMIHAYSGYGFNFAAGNGHVEMLKYLVELVTNPERRERMIHGGGKEYAWIKAAQNGHVEVMKYLVEITNPEHNKIMIMEKQAFQSAASSGSIESMKYILELIGNNQKKEVMIHHGNAFQCAAVAGKIEVMKYLIELTPNQEHREKMIHAENDKAFQYAAEKSHLEILQYLVELTSQFPSPAQTYKMIQNALSHIFTQYSEPVLQFLLIHMDEEHFQQNYIKEYDQGRDKDIVIKLLPEVIHERRKKRIINICKKLDLNHDFIHHLSKDTLETLIQDLKHWSLLLNLHTIVKDGLPGFQHLLHPLLPDEIFSMIIYFYSDQITEQLSERVKQKHGIKGLIKYYT
jgi:hypothetical protein